MFNTFPSVFSCYKPTYDVSGCVLFGACSAALICGFMSFTKFGEFSAILSLNLSLVHVLPPLVLEPW